MEYSAPRLPALRLPEHMDSQDRFDVVHRAPPWTYRDAVRHREPAATSLFRQKYAHARCEHSPPSPL